MTPITATSQTIATPKIPANHAMRPDMTTAVIFPGQGSQQIGMGGILLEKYSDYISLTNDIIGKDIRELCLQGPEEALNDTANTQVAIYLCNAVSYLEWRESHCSPNYVLGHSIGQYNAMLAAEMISFEEGLRLVKLRGDLMAQQHGGAMAAVMKVSSQELLDALASHHYGQQIDVANFNSEYQTVISLNDAIFDEVAEYLIERDAYIVRLKTSGAFHSRYMKAAKDTFEIALKDISFASPKIKLICNLTADYIDEPQHSLGEHLVSPVKWYQSIYKVFTEAPDTEFHECGWGKTLTNILRFNRKEFFKKIPKIA